MKASGVFAAVTLLTAALMQGAGAQSAGVNLAPPPPSSQAPLPVPPMPADVPATNAAPPPPLQTSASTTLLLRGLDKITGRPTDILAPIGKPVHFATLTITARYCYSTPPSETPETAAFVQIEDQRPEQGARRIFSGWMYASSPGLNAVEHPLYDVWVITCNAGAPGVAPPAAMASTAPVKVQSPDSSDKEGPTEPLPEGAGH